MNNQKYGTLIRSCVYRSAIVFSSADGFMMVVCKNLTAE